MSVNDFGIQDVISAAMIGFDMIEGPYLKWYQEFQDYQLNMNIEDFYMNLYLSFRSGNSDDIPKAIIYEKFYLVAYPYGLELVCLFLKPNAINDKIDELQNIANQIVSKMENEEESLDDLHSNQEHDVEEIKRILLNMIRGNQISTPEFRKHFNLSNSEIWRIMNALETDNLIRRTQKVGRTQYWTAST